MVGLCYFYRNQEFFIPFCDMKVDDDADDGVSNQTRELLKLGRCTYNTNSILRGLYKLLRRVREMRSKQGREHENMNKLWL